MGEGRQSRETKPRGDASVMRWLRIGGFSKSSDVYHPIKKQERTRRPRARPHHAGYLSEPNPLLTAGAAMPTLVMSLAMVIWRGGVRRFVFLACLSPHSTVHVTTQR